MKVLLLNLFIFLSLQTVAQIVNQTESYQAEQMGYQRNSREFTALKKNFRDSIQPKSLIYWNKKGYELSLNPAFDLQMGLKSNNDPFLYRTGIGTKIRAKKGKWNLGFSYLRQNAEYMDYQTDFIENNSVVPSMNVADGNGQFSSDFVRGFLNFKTAGIFDFELGYGRNFIGDGYRSLLISDHGKSYPYLKTSAKFWNVQYTSMISIHQDIFQVEGNSDLHRKKYIATHYLDWKVADWFSLGLFESIVWQDEEENFQRGFDVNYLNPVIYFRPVEFSVGSSDNALVGTNLKFTLSKNHHLYFQLVFDEFLLDEIRADVRQKLNPDDSIRSGWWGNKYAVQFGYKGFEMFGVEGLRTQVELNIVRPFTYTHSSSTQSFSNFNLPLAHPLGANFEELVTKVDYFKQKWSFHFQWNYSRQGQSEDGSNYGENLQISNTSRIRDFENEIGQGNLNEVHFLSLKAKYLIKKEWNTFISLGIISRHAQDDFQQLDEQMISISISSNLFNQYFDF